MQDFECFWSKRDLSPVTLQQVIFGIESKSAEFVQMVVLRVFSCICMLFGGGSLISGHVLRTLNYRITRVTVLSTVSSRAAIGSKCSSLQVPPCKSTLLLRLVFREPHLSSKRASHPGPAVRSHSMSGN